MCVEYQNVAETGCVLWEKVLGRKIKILLSNHFKTIYFLPGQATPPVIKKCIYGKKKT
jgi:hypothetical protein